MKNYSDLFETAKNSRDTDTMQRIFDEVLNMVKVDTDEETGAKIAEARNNAGKEGRKI